MQNPANPKGVGLMAAYLGAGLMDLGLLASGGQAGTVVLGLSGVMLATNSVARLMNSPVFMKWLAKASLAPLANLPQHIAKLSVLVNNSNNTTFINDATAFISTLSAGQEQVDEQEETTIPGSEERQRLQANP